MSPVSCLLLELPSTCTFTDIRDIYLNCDMHLNLNVHFDIYSALLYHVKFSDRYVWVNSADPDLTAI